ncbi:restriction endonuclease subunit S [Leuconostoc mesenteroides]|uniref:restriction endonuclease subunit S n=1 Tax=Leuconostoc mesenteroides TaxID=1245 RepID=UPI0021822109|nr:restriction endonuclease subunit S [Leuconostoc mesenteroides]MCS8585697.1 restriction endonuclease subunit S [Leuconostoc mesenteroides]
MQTKKRKSPSLRFRGYTDDWEERKLGDEFKKVSERNNGSFGRNHWISVAKMYFQTPEKVQSNNIDTRTYVMREGDIAFEGHPNSEFKFGRFVANDIGAGVVSELFPIYRHQHEYDNNYWKNAIQIERIMAPIFAKSITSSGNSSNKLDTKHFLRQKILIPQINEQKKMGSFFKQLDNTIALYQRKLDLLKEQKKGFLQKMFPKNGAKVPELRFAGFADDWEERKFADFIDVKSGKDYKHLNSGSIPVYGTGGYMLSVDRALSDIDAIGIGRKGTIDKPYLLKAPFWTVDTLFYAVPKQNIDLQFSLSIFKKINWKKFDESTGVPSLSKTVINSVGASVPSYEEQQKIGSFFQQLDETIALHQRKLDLLKEQKKGFLQKMFV